MFHLVLMVSSFEECVLNYSRFYRSNLGNVFGFCVTIWCFLCVQLYVSAAVHEILLVFSWCLWIAVALHSIKRESLSLHWMLNLNNNK